MFNMHGSKEDRHTLSRSGKPPLQRKNTHVDLTLLIPPFGGGSRDRHFKVDPLALLGRRPLRGVGLAVREPVGGD